MEKTEAEKKYAKYKSLDPYPEIQPALLNSADIENYINETGMVEPFNKKDLKSASYEAKINGICKYWDGNGKEQELAINRPCKTFTLKPNSIAFVEVEPTFRLPDYIALRFNLKIKHVYRGLLLGTGPLIDPGYVGKIYIPLHNLTSNSYTFEYGEGLIWIEFTKISDSDRWKGELNKNVEKNGEYKPFPPEKTNKSLGYFLHKATKSKPIKSSIPSAIGEAKNSAKQAEATVKKLAAVGIVSALAVAISIIALVYNTWLLQRNYVDEMSEMNIWINKQRSLQIKTEKDLVNANMQITDLKTKIDLIFKEKKVKTKH